MSKPLGCMRCGAYTSLTSVGYAWFCTSCIHRGALPPCTPGHHVWRGGIDMWFCSACGIVMPTADSPAAAPAILPPYSDE